MNSNAQQQQSKPLSFLQALGVSSKTITIGEQEGTFYELTTQQVAELLEQAGSLVSVIMLMMDLVSAGPSSYAELFASSQAKLTKETKDLIFKILGYSLRVEADTFNDLSPKYLPDMLVAVYETNADFFASFGSQSQKLKAKFPKIAALWTAGQNQPSDSLKEDSDLKTSE